MAIDNGYLQEENIQVITTLFDHSKYTCKQWIQALIFAISDAKIMLRRL